MSYVESNLLNGEEVYRAYHPIVYAPAIIFGPIGLFFVAAAIAGKSDVLTLLGVVSLVIFAFAAVTAYVDIKTSEFAVTNRRVLIKVGWIRRESFEIFLPKVEGIGVDQGVFGRMFDFGTIGVRGTGGSRERFGNIAAPLEFRRQVQALIPEQ